MLQDPEPRDRGLSNLLRRSVEYYYDEEDGEIVCSAYAAGVAFPFVVVLDGTPDESSIEYWGTEDMEVKSFKYRGIQN